MKRILSALKNEGPWAIFVFFSRLRNYVRVAIIRRLLGVPDIYFQGAPKIMNRRGIHFGRNFRCGPGLWIEAVFGHGMEKYGIKITIGDDFTASEYLHIGAVESIVIGKNVLIGSHVLITDHSHGAYGAGGEPPSVPPNQRALAVRGPVIIGDNVWICDGVKILSGVKIGSGAIIAANSVVRADVPENCIYSSVAHGTITRQYNVVEKKWSAYESK
ncbi:acyltransferase [Duganella sp. FT27W]|uniref:acyltransferase n=1 Tax=Duganella sp. FT27W TaxID=2654636 RepID=UPI00128CAA1A|nr:acyltransferase [Duganella sp. FT27W]MPQ57139.1 acyltransferase [Duganella sp. FT27W]